MEVGGEQRLDWREVGENFLLHISPVQRRASLNEVLGGKRIVPGPGCLRHPLREDRKELSGRGFDFGQPFSLITRRGGLCEGFWPRDAELCSCSLADIVQIRAGAWVW